MGNNGTVATDPTRWVDDHGDSLYRFALLKVRDADLAAELVQETFLAALKGRQRFSGQSSERTWLIGILKHKLLDHRRRAARESRQVAEPSDNEAFHTKPIEDRLFDDRGFWRVGPRRWSSTDPERALQRSEFWEVLQGCLDRLPPTLAEAFLLRELEGLGTAAVCQALGISSKSLWTRLHRARLSLRGCLEARWFSS